jgi:hypothetical protein
MTKDEMTTLLRGVGVNDNTVVAMCNAFDMGVEYEREACANVCEEEARMHDSLDRNGRSRHIDDAAIAKTCAAAIRARGQV